MAQGDEGIFYYQGNGDGTFKARQALLRFPPSYGSTYFDLKDLNQDGKMDIIYVNGDNGDYTPLMKPYHGVHFFYGDDSGLQFNEGPFFHVNGAFKVIIEDFDSDNDLDFAVISYFPDQKHSPEEGFLYFLKEKRDYRAFSIGISTQGPWLVMDAADYDGDGDLDLVLGRNNLMSKTNTEGGIVILNNRTK